MFRNVSLAGTGWLILLLGLVSTYFDFDLDEEQLTELANAILLLVGFISAVVGQLRRKDLKWGLLRK